MNSSEIKNTASTLLEADVAHDDIREITDIWNNSEELRSSMLSSAVTDEEKERIADRAFSPAGAACIKMLLHKVKSLAVNYCFVSIFECEYLVG